MEFLDAACEVMTVVGIDDTGAALDEEFAGADVLGGGGDSSSESLSVTTIGSFFFSGSFAVLLLDEVAFGFELVLLSSAMISALTE